MPTTNPKVNYLCGRDSNPKTRKGQKKEIMTLILYLLPHKGAGKNVCAFASPGCIDVCLNTAGRGIFPPIQKARLERTKWLFSDRKGFMKQLDKEISLFVKYVNRYNKKHGTNFEPAVRLNGTSDLPWEDDNFTGGIMSRYWYVQFYDYTKNYFRAMKWANGEMPHNYHLTFSWNELQVNQEWAVKIAQAGGNIAVVFKNGLPDTFLGLPVINGDEDDLRFLDGKGVVVGLTAKGKAKKSKSKFVVDTLELQADSPAKAGQDAPTNKAREFFINSLAPSAI